MITLNIFSVTVCASEEEDPALYAAKCDHIFEVYYSRRYESLNVNRHRVYDTVVQQCGKCPYKIVTDQGTYYDETHYVPTWTLDFVDGGVYGYVGTCSICKANLLKIWEDPTGR